MFGFMKQPAYKPIETGPAADAKYRRMRWQVFIGAFIGYAGFYLVRKNLSMAIPSMEPLGFHKAELGLVLGLNAAGYAFSKFLMGSVSDRSNARVFLPLGLVLSAITMCFMIVPIKYIGAEHKALAIVVMGVLNALVGWFNGMGWPPCGRVMTHWFSQNERGTMMSIWNCAHNVGGGLVGPMATYGVRPPSGHATVLWPAVRRGMAQRLPEELLREAGGDAVDEGHLLQVRPEQQVPLVHRALQCVRLHGTLRVP